LRYDFSRENTNGSYWDNKLSRLSASVTVPLLPYIYAQKFGPVYLQLTGSIAEQQYFYWQPYIDVDGSVKQDTRKDRIYTESASVNWEIAKNWSMILQYTHTKWDSNIPVYEYKRNQYMAGLEFRF
jgi:lipopolysaccharide assembly outer membrane protein LptD (OstA)